ncbi:MAG: thiamine phosphate synthase [Gammaproteobacteria bacterium]|nr:thiamine phosphate synthase [Gammaproteobacteria bacterium]
MNQRTLLRGLYAITNSPQAADRDLPNQVSQALEGGTRVIQYRDKGKGRQRRVAEASQLLQLTKQYHALLIINDDIELAAETGADGVHLGRHDADITHARQRLGTEAIIGISCYNRLALAKQAEQAGADYVAFGRFFPSLTKPQAVQANPQLLRQARQTLTLPLVAIGGITPDNGGPLISAGADMLAVIHAVFGQPDIRQACERFRPIFATGG